MAKSIDHLLPASVLLTPVTHGGDDEGGEDDDDVEDDDEDEDDEDGLGRQLSTTPLPPLYTL